MRTKEKQRSIFYILIVAIGMIAGMIFPNAVFASEVQSKTEPVSQKITKKAATQATGQIVISKIKVIFRITDEMENALKNGGDIPEIYNSGPDGAKDNIADYTAQVPSIMDVTFYDENSKSYSMDELNQILKSDNYTLKMAYGWKDKMGYYQTISKYLTSISKDTQNCYLELRFEVFNQSGGRENVLFIKGSTANVDGKPDVDVYLEKEAEEYLLKGKGNGYQEGYWSVLKGLGSRNEIVRLKNIALHIHSWEYKQDSTHTNEVLAYCKQEEYSDGCGYQGEANARILRLNASDMVYTGQKYNQATVSDDISSVTGAKRGEIYYEGVNYKKTTEPPTVPGTYTASVTIGEIIATKNFTISKLGSTFMSPTAKTLTYNGTEQELVNSGSTDCGTLCYRIKDDGAWQEGEVPKAKDAKAYTVLYYLKGDAFHENIGSESEPAGTVDVVVNPRDITATITPNGGIYGNVEAATVVLNGVCEVDKDVVSIDLKYSGTANDGTAVSESSDVPEKAGNYTVFTGTLSNTNYKLKGDSRQFIISKAEREEPKVTAVSEEVNGQGNGQITGVNSSMEYRKNDETVYTGITGEISVLHYHG